MPTSQTPAKKTSPAPTRATSFDPAVAKVFAGVIRDLREQSGLAQDKFALLANVDRSYYGKLERGERQPSLALFLRISDALGITGTELLGLVEPKLPKSKR